MFKTLVLSVSVVLSASGLCRADDGMQANIDAFAQAFCGIWTGKTQLDRDAEGLGKKGDSLVAHMTYRMQDGLILVEWQGEVNGKPAGTKAKGVVGWDAAEKKIKLSWFASSGSSGTMYFTRLPDGWERQATSVLPDGSKGTARALMKFRDADNYTDNVSERTEGGDKLPDRVVAWQRAK
jgi:hypothetical protein